MSNATTPCRICTYQAELVPSRMDGEHRKCLHCGEYRIESKAFEMMDRYARHDGSRMNLFGWVRNQNNQGTVPTITSDILERVASRPLPSVAERADLLLLEIVRSQTVLDDSVDIRAPHFNSASYSHDDGDVLALSQMLCSLGVTRVADHANLSVLLVTYEGYKRADDLKKRPLYSTTSFVAMRFLPDLDDAYDHGISPAVINAGYKPIRVDKTQHVKRIDDEIISRIRASALVIADFTDHSPGVYFEAGFALGLGLPVIWTCRKDHMEELHFDIRQYNCIDWETPKELAARLQPRIEAIVGKGPKAPFDES